LREKSITLILGGAGSGKSRYAQALASGMDDVVFLATAQASDEEMHTKIQRHRRERPANWKTVEVPFELVEAIVEHNSSSFVIVDCLTTFVANWLVLKKASSEAIFACIADLADALSRSNATVALVSNEVGSGVVPEFLSGREFRDILGQVNQKIARICDNVVLMIAGYPLAIKGTAEVKP
jgi:adenosylcobinamide kinase / adenosylcobinamide-phosphate guanylyltransferase